MIKVENIETWGFEHSIRGMRNPLNSWDKSDSKWCENDCEGCESVVHYQPCPAVKMFARDELYTIGSNDLSLMRKLFQAGTEHRKYLRQIFVSMDIIAPLYWWKEFDTYKVGTVANSCSTMHKIQAKKFELSDFSHEHLIRNGTGFKTLLSIIDTINFYREMYLETKDKSHWWQMIQLLPSSYNQRRTVTMTYENVFSMINQRRLHKLDEWQLFCGELYKLPYVKEILED